ncbi:LacI family DNA-binding transcriptional regulator [Seonamhaeicola aphaedonensis]|uniref:LacI family transcriptional regulator n=1 Tax=Seonamhaeicola aphaedonensis TaxID=1461338 RepID=A0A3D9HM34_9FLAO|nr:LacI family DNA-binding transcriptional regulator [Seonamhaeicola aphaedonensis]RED50557.1 LacI family transcriptional regulator [Seonamhaeicola aphaedonensis]
MKKRITLKHIANQFDVSIATVSKALSDSYEISAKTKEKIQQYAKEHHYKPNSVALSLLNKKTKTIGVIIPNIMNNFFAKVFVGIEEKATEKGYSLISCISNESYEKEVKTMELLKNGTLDGFILSLAEETQEKEQYQHLKNTINEGVPMVLFDRVTDEIACDKVIVDDFEGARNATNHLIKTGCKRIALISVIDNLSVGKLRAKGYEKALTDNNITIDPKLIVKIGKREDFETAMKIVLADKSIDGLLCLEESSAVQSLEIVKRMGYHMPNEMSIICFTNGKLPQYVTPRITTISQHGKYIGEMAAKILIDRLEGEIDAPFQTKVIKTSLIERESTKRI